MEGQGNKKGNKKGKGGTKGEGGRRWTQWGRREGRGGR
jgi:hypothetical protein